MFRKLFQSSENNICRPNSTKARHLHWEKLEDRLCLSANPVVVNSELHDISSSLNIASEISAPAAISMPNVIAAKMDSQLWSALQDDISGATTSTGPISSNPLQILAKRSATDDIEIVVEVGTWSANVVSDLSTLGIDVTLSNESLKKVQGWASASEIDALLADGNVAYVSLPDYGVTNAGLVTTEGDAILRTDEVRSVFENLGIDGTGIRVGVISDGVDNRATVASTGDLPSSITVNPSLPGGGDEGTAMLEIVHDLAPGAELFFSSGISGTMAMIDSVNWLVSQGVDIIVDDLGFFLQPYFEDGAIADTVASAVASGVSYFSSAGNQAGDHYQADFDLSGTFTYNGVLHELHEFASGDIALGVAIAPGGRADVILQWSDQFGASANDYNLFFFDNTLTNILDVGDVQQDGTQNPIETVSLVNNGATPAVVQLVVARVAGAADRELELFVLNDVAQEYAVPTDAIIGHQARTEVVTVAAIDQADPGNDDIQAFSSRGPSTIYTNFMTQTSTTRNSLDGAAIDGVQTRTGDLGLTNINGASLDPFFGTSAAAPHAAAIAALLLDINPLLTPAAISTILADTAVDILANGYDDDSGAGRFDAYAAATSILPPTILDVTLSGSSWANGVEYAFSDLVAAGDQLRPIATQNVNTIEIQFSENVFLDGSELELRWTERLADGTSQNSTVASTGFSYDVGAHVATWTFGNLGDGKYSLELSDTVTDVAGNALDGDWSAMDSGTIDIYSDDPGSAFNVGNGVAGSPDYDMDGDGEFRLHFALLAGDYDGNGIVEATEAVTGDGDGDGTIGDADDINLRNSQAALNAKLPLLAAGGDFFDDEWINNADFAAWAQGFGGEFNGNDFLIWQRTYNSKSVWYVPSSSLAATASFDTVGLPPQVLNVIVSGSVSLHDPFSMDTVVGSGSQLATVPVGGADTISIVFSEGVNVDANSLMVIGLTTATLPQVADFSYDAATNTATWRFEGWALGDQYVLSLSDAITDLEGNNLDGEWTNPTSINTINSAVSTFPSGDGLSGGRFNFVMTLLPGDANLDGIVDGFDLNVLGTNWGVTVDALFTDGDFSGDGAVAGTDLYFLAPNYGTNLQNIWALADMDGDNDIDDDDLDIITSNMGMTGATWADGDLNGDGQVTLEDLDLAFAQFGLGLDLAA